MKQSTFLRIDSTDRLHRVDTLSPLAPPGQGYTISIGDGTGSYTYLQIGDREVDVPAVADKLIELLDAMRWQALRRIAIRTDEERAEEEKEAVR